MYTIKILKQSFLNLVFLGLERMGDNWPRLEEDYKETKISKNIKKESIKELLKKDYVNPKLKTNIQIVKETLWPDYIDKDWEDFRNIMWEKTKEELKQEKENFGFSKEVMLNLLDSEKKTLLEVLGEKTIKQTTSWEIYTLKQEWLDLSKLFLKDKNWKFSKWKSELKTWDEFIIDFYGNKDIDRIIWIWDILDINKISKISVNWVNWERRNNPRPGFYNGRYLAVHNNFKINILEEKEFNWDKFNNSIYSRFSQVRWKELESWIYTHLNSGDSSINIPFNTKSDKDLFQKYIENNFWKDLYFDYKNNNLKSIDWKPLNTKQEIISSNMIPKNSAELMKIPWFAEKLSKVCSNLWVSKNDLLIVIWAESNYNPKAINSRTWASGLIQFMPSTAKDLGTTISAIRQMWAVEQLTLVERFYKKNNRWVKLNNVVDLYKATFFPLSLEHPENSWVFRAKWIDAWKIARQNPWISKYSTRSDWFIDWNAFRKYVMAKVSSSVIIYQDIENDVSDSLEYDGKMNNEYINWKDKYNSSLKNTEKYTENILKLKNWDWRVKEIPWFPNMITWELNSISLVEKYALKWNWPAFDQNWKQIIFTSPESRRKKSSIQNSKNKEWISIHGSAWNDRSLISGWLNGGLYAFSVLSNWNIIQNQDFNDWYWALWTSSKLWKARLNSTINRNVIAIELALPQKNRKWDYQKLKSWNNWKSIDIVEDPSHNQMVATGNLIKLIKFKNSKINKKEMFIMDSIDAVMWTDWNWVSGMHWDFFRDDFMKAIWGLSRAERQKLIYEKYWKNWAKVDKEVLSKYERKWWDVLA